MLYGWGVWKSQSQPGRSTHSPTEIEETLNKMLRGLASSVSSCPPPPPPLGHYKMRAFLFCPFVCYLSFVFRHFNVEGFKAKLKQTI